VYAGRVNRIILKLTIDIQVRDILQSGTDIIVFSAHPSLLAGSGVSDIVHKAAGPELEVLAKNLGPIVPGQSVELRDRVRLVISITA